jgi:hypothetical protein
VIAGSRMLSLGYRESPAKVDEFDRRALGVARKFHQVPSGLGAVSVSPSLVK